MTKAEEEKGEVGRERTEGQKEVTEGEGAAEVEGGEMGWRRRW